MYDPGLWTASQEIWASTDSDTGDVNSVSAMGDECRVCPVGVGQESGVGLGLGLAALNPIMHHLVKGIKIPVFDDAAEDWPSFMWDFREFLQKLSPTKEIADAYKLGLLEQAITPTLRGEIKLMRKRNGGTVTYPEVLARFEARYSTGGVAKLRKKWNEVSMNTSGKISSKQLREFQVNFLSCADYVKDTTPQEVRRVLMQKLPPWMKTWVAEAEQKKERNRPIVQIIAVEGMTEESMKRTIKKLIGDPRSKCNAWVEICTVSLSMIMIWPKNCSRSTRVRLRRGVGLCKSASWSKVSMLSKFLRCSTINWPIAKGWIHIM